MRFLLLLLFICTVVFSAKGQSLTYSQLLKLQQMSKLEFGQFMQKRGWTAKTDEGPSEDMMGKAVWAFSPETSGEGAIAWCILYYSNNNPNRILYNITGGRTFEKIRKKVEKRGSMLPVAGTQAEYVATYFDFDVSNHVARLFTYKNPSYYGIKVFAKEDYLIAKKNGKL